MDAQLVKGLGENALVIPENNTSNEYCWMFNAKGRKVPVAIKNVADALKRGFAHVDQKIVSDDLSKSVRRGRKSKVKAEVALAEAITKLAEASAKKETSTDAKTK